MAYLQKKTLALVLILGMLISIVASSPMFGDTDDFAPLVGDLVPGDSGLHAQAGNRGCNGGRPGGPGGPPPPPSTTTTTTASSG